MPDSTPFRVLAKGRYVQFVERDGWEFIDQPGLRGVVVIVAVTPDDRMVLVEQFRPPLNARTLEMPAGMVGDKAGTESEPFELAAARELEEETGFLATRFERLTEGPASPARSTMRYTFFRAHDLRRVHAGGGDEHEDITVHLAPLDGIVEWLTEKERGGLLIDPKIWAGLHFVERTRKRT